MDVPDAAFAALEVRPSEGCSVGSKYPQPLRCGPKVLRTPHTPSSPCASNSCFFSHLHPVPASCSSRSISGLLCCECGWLSGQRAQSQRVVVMRDLASPWEKGIRGYARAKPAGSPQLMCGVSWRHVGFVKLVPPKNQVNANSKGEKSKVVSLERKRLRGYTHYPNHPFFALYSPRASELGKLFLPEIGGFPNLASTRKTYNPQLLERQRQICPIHHSRAVSHYLAVAPHSEMTEHRSIKKKEDLSAGNSSTCSDASKLRP